MLWPLDLRLSRQNPEPEGLTRKILENKELAASFGSPFWAVLRKILICYSYARAAVRFGGKILRDKDLGRSRSATRDSQSEGGRTLKPVGSPI
jgi:hypothetical protein